VYIIVTVRPVLRNCGDNEKFHELYKTETSIEKKERKRERKKEGKKEMIHSDRTTRNRNDGQRSSVEF